MGIKTIYIDVSLSYSIFNFFGGKGTPSAWGTPNRENKHLRSIGGDLVGVIESYPTDQKFFNVFMDLL